ncbi:hypothetical protein COV18_06435 [Candidatus Woesearchaeota archaeon CG10_big_fil_rev_8_21_14_0_10_37_12]|nr:MAG: hypothetical protein COV18_06435 [Candidatus Woesearchaeota archaeon CG10_big_fil_rev_8_21_14_0_10_37_12]
MSQKTFEQICALLDKQNIQYEVMEHEPVRTSEEAAIARGRTPEEGLKRGAKAMILRSEGKFYQFIIPAHKRIDLKKVKLLLQKKSLSFATGDEVVQVTDCLPGSVPPFGNLWNIPVFADSGLNEELDFNAGLREKSITMKRVDWEKIVQPRIVELC